jgi:hypothetical protein
MRGDLAWVTSQSGRVAGDVRSLSDQVRRGDTQAARRYAIRLKLDSLSFAAASRHFGNELRSLSGTKNPGPVHTYLYDLNNSLSDDWYEGKALARLADVVWADPLAIVPSTSSRLAYFQSEAKQFARRSATAARDGAALRRRYARLFHYAPVKQASASR